MPQKDKATFVKILNKYLDPRWSDQDLADAVGVKDRSTANRWKSADYPTMPQGETLDKLVEALKVGDETDRFLFYGAAGYLAPPADAVVQATLPDVVAVIFNYIVTDGMQAATDKLERYVRQYLSWVQETYGRVTFRGVRRGGSQLIELPLDEVYVPLTAQSRGWGTNRLNLNQLLQQGNRLVVTGGPGCGKTTVLQHVAWTLATAIAADDMALARDRVGLEGTDDETIPLPIFIPLSAYARHRRQHQGDGDPHNRTLATFIADYLIERNCAPGLPRDFFARLLNSGRGVILVLDGLDEVPDEAERAQVRQAIESLLAGKPKLRAVVTCRIAAYKGRTALGADFREVRVEPLADEHIEALVTRAYDCYFAHDSAQALDKRTELLAGIELLEQQRRARLGDAAPQLVDSPLMVRLLLIVHLNERRLPQHRAELYQKAVDNLLYPEYALDEMAAEHLRGLVGGSHEMHRDMVQHVAYAMHSQGEEQGREIDETALRRVLAEEPTFVPYIDDLIRHTRLRGALLEERLGSYRFVHLAFQEFLAARYLAEVMRTEQEIAQFLIDHAIGNPWWREPALLTAGYLSLTSRRTADRLLRLLAVWEGHAAGNHRAADVRLAAAELAGTACLEWLGDEAALRGQVTAQLATLFTNCRIMEQAAPPVKLLAGDALGRLGDPRPGVGVKHGLPDIAWIKVPEFDPLGRREFVYQKGKHTGLRDFWIAKYPITYTQFQCFVEAPDGYFDTRWWEGLADNCSGNSTTRYKQNWQIANRPREMVTWYESLAFCRWMSAMLQEHPDLLAPSADLREIGAWQVRLPDEREWEKAARGWDGRQYPWGSKYEIGRANVDETERKDGPYYLRETSPVGMYPHGASPFGVEDLAGNVWEWCRNEYERPENMQDFGNKQRVLRGGSWNNAPHNAASSVRDRSGPVSVVDFDGFRVVVCASP